jgi:hypothetical protein
MWHKPASNEVTLSYEPMETDLRIFFMCFLIMHLQLTSAWTAIWGSLLSNSTRFCDVPLNPKSASIPSGVFRKHLKKIVRFVSSSLLIGCRLRHKPAFNEVIIVPMDGHANQWGAWQAVDL